MWIARFAHCVGLAWLVALSVSTLCYAQTENATISGRVTDSSGAALAKARVDLESADKGTTTATTTNSAGIYVFASVHPGVYHIMVRADGFKTENYVGLTANIQDHLEQNFRLTVGAVSESITVTGNELHVNTEDATVSTVVDRQFAENLPLNGRSFQALIQLTPGVVLTPANAQDSGQFSVNGQRADGNYWMLDGVSANIGVNGTGAPGNGLGGALGSFSTLGGTNSLVSVDAMQEFRIQTSTYAPEFGRTPGGQISIVTRSGTNQFHGTAFDYLRNDVLDASYWFNGYINNPPLPKAKERQNDFGGTVSGPIFKDKTFFFFSYEGLRLRLPQTTLTSVPDASFTSGGTTNSRQNAILGLQPFLNAYPLPNPSSPEIFAPCDPNTDPTCPPTGQKATGTANFNASYSNPATLDAYSIRIDHSLSYKWNLFGRYSYSPSEIVRRALLGVLSTVSPTRITTQTATVGATWAISSAATNDLRFNYSRTNASSHNSLDSFGGAVPLTSVPFPSPYTTQNASLLFDIFSTGPIAVGKNEQNVQRQINVVDGLSIQRGKHSVKFGVDFRRLSPLASPASYLQQAFFLDVPSAETGNPFVSFVSSGRPATFLFRNLGVYTQDTWRIGARLALTYGLRWDIDFVPQSIDGPSFAAVTGFNLKNLSNLALAPSGTSPFKTTYGNVAPRIGLAYQVSQSRGWQTVVRGGFGVFYDLVSSEGGNVFSPVNYPFGAGKLNFGGTFPLDPTSAAPPPITPAGLSSPGAVLLAFDPHLELPYTLEWNVALEQALGGQQTISASYVGAAGRRLLQTALVQAPNPIISSAQLVTNVGTSDYDALQIQFQRRLSRGLQALANYTWSHSIDTASAGSLGNVANALVPAINSKANRGPSDFDVRNAFSAGVTYDIPAPKINRLTNAILGGWSLQNIIQARSALPVNVYESSFAFLLGGNAQVRPDLVPGQPVYLFGSQCIAVLGAPCAGGKGFNPSAFTNPPVDPNTGNPLRQGNLGRNALRGFSAMQWDFGVHRDFAIHESLKLQFRAEMFNVLNHPNFGLPQGGIGASFFGESTQMLGQSLAGVNIGAGAFDPLYQIGGARSIQLALKLMF